ncbi:hypothetical protein ElyMa_006621100 [Elysia marginata]|uniref:Uncharacterized protein n=1 Tax=Elysia marginata TaxID=1093978 RepID=A0AAV4IJP9_9GAST|nr:hypothetical protein ElyMa_006621100 [Elysia marginata]
MSSCSDDLLSTLVSNIRQACEQHITFEDFTSVSGLICFDIDGFKQKSFVISELLQKKSVGEGNSSHLKTLNWKSAERKDSGKYFESKESPTKPLQVDGSVCSRALGGQTELRKSLRDPRGSFAILHTKLDWCNRTFTLKPKIHYEVEPAVNSHREENSTTISASKDITLKDEQGNSQIKHEENIYLERGGERRWLKGNCRSKAKPNYRNCYPGLPKKPLKRYQTPCQTNKTERQFTKHSTDNKSEPLNESDHLDNIKRLKTLYNSPSEKPTALSWYETSLAPSSSVESIESIQPFYLVPHSEPLSNPPYSKSQENNVSKDAGYVHRQVHTPEYTNFATSAPDPIIQQPTTIPAHFSKEESRDHHSPYSSLNQKSPVKTVPAHSTTSNGTLNTISSIEQDVRTVTETKPHQASWEQIDRAPEAVSLPRAHHDSQILSECSVVSRKRASLMKWMGLFKKGSKTSAEETSIKQRHMTKLKSGKNIPAPPMEIRIKQWN